MLWIDVLLPSNLLLKTVPSQASRAGEMGVYPFISPVYEFKTARELVKCPIISSMSEIKKRN